MNPERLVQALVLLGLVLVLGLYNLSVREKETVLRQGQVVRLALAPRDPRSLLTGDYMVLNYALAREIDARITEPARESETSQARRARRETERRDLDGYAIVKLDAQRVGTLVRTQQAPQPVGQDEMALKFRVRQGRVQVGVNAWFFEEGSAGRFEPARYGEYRVDTAGEMLLTGMLGEKLDPL